MYYRYLTPANPRSAPKLIYCAVRFWATFFTRQTGRALGFNKAASVLMGVVYISAPHLLINIHGCGAYTDDFAPVLLPLLAYAAVRFVQQRTAVGYVWLSLAWLALGTSPLTAFIYSIAFYFLLTGSVYFGGSPSICSPLSLLDIRLNGNSAPYNLSSYRSLDLSAVNLMLGRNKIVSTFAGSKPGNDGSIMGLLIALGVVAARHRRLKSGKSCQVGF